MFQRYAVYTTFPPGPMADALSAWLGWDSAAGQDVPHPELPDFGLDLAKITKRPRKYGAHGTIKAPFRLAPGADATALQEALRAHCALRSKVVLGPLQVSSFGRFLALTLREPNEQLSTLAAETVTGLDMFRAPLTAEDLARRRRASLTPRQEDHLTRWGYPHVFQDFKFHVTLTGPLDPVALPAVQDALEGYLAPYLKVPFTLDALSFLGEHQDTGRFHVIERVPLASN